MEYIYQFAKIKKRNRAYCVTDRKGRFERKSTID